MKRMVKCMLLLGIYLVLDVCALHNVNAYTGWFEDTAVGFLDHIVDESNEDADLDVVQYTAMDKVTSHGWFCKAPAKDSRFSFSTTLCWIENNMYHYLQYAVYIGLAIATMLIVWNGFNLVVSKDNQAQFQNFQKNLISIAIGVILLVAFYYIIDLFVSVVNLVAG